MKRALVLTIAAVPLVAGCALLRTDPVPPSPALVGVEAQNAAWANKIQRGRDNKATFTPLEKARTALEEARSQAKVEEYDSQSLQQAEQALSDAESTWQEVAGDASPDPATLGRIAGDAHRAQRLAEIAQYTAMREINLDQLAAVTREFESSRQQQVKQSASSDADLLGTRVIPGRLGEIGFQAGTPKLTDQSRQVVARLSALLRSNPDYGIAILGHTDNTAPAQSRLDAFVRANPGLDEKAPTHDDKVSAFNLALSSARARAVARLLVENGIPARRIGARGFGDRRPVATNDTAEGRSTNRRVEAIVVPGPDSPGRQSSQGGG